MKHEPAGRITAPAAAVRPDMSAAAVRPALSAAAHEADNKNASIRTAALCFLMILAVCTAGTLGAQPQSQLPAQPRPQAQDTGASEFTAPDVREPGWFEIRTEYTRIIFQAADRAAADELASFADEVVDRLTGVLGWGPEGLVPVVLRGNTDLANGYFTVAPRRIVLMLSPDGVYPGYFGPVESWLQLVFTHELVHYLQLDPPVGIFHGFSRVFGNLLAGMDQGLLPGWFIEGSAVYLETLLTAGGRGRSGSFAMEILASVYDLDTWSYRQTWYDSPDEFDTRIYRSGALLVDYIADGWGFEVLNEVLEETLRSPFSREGFDGRLSRALGMNLDDLWAAAQRRFTAAFRDQLFLEPGTLWDRGPEIPADESVISIPQPAAGGSLVYYRDGTTSASIRFVPENGERALLPLVSVNFADPAGFATAGNLVVFPNRETRTAGRDRDSLAVQSRLWAAVLAHPVPGGTPLVERLIALTPANGQDFHSPTLTAADGGRIRLAVLRRDGSAHSLVTADLTDIGTAGADSPEFRVLYSEGTRLSHPSYSPCGRYIALVETEGTDSGASTSRVIILDAETGLHAAAGSVRMPYTLEYPRWSPDSASIVVVSDAAGSRQAFLVPLSGSAPSELEPYHSDPVGIVAALPCPDGTVLYSTARSRTIRVLRAEPNRYSAPAGFANPFTAAAGVETAPGADSDGAGDTGAAGSQSNTADSRGDAAGTAATAPFDPSDRVPPAGPLRSSGALTVNLWFPYPLLDIGGVGIDWGPAAYLMAADAVEETNLTVSAGYYVAGGQPVLSLALDRALGQADLSVRLAQDSFSTINANSIPETRQVSAVEVVLGVPFGQYREPGLSVSHRATIGISAEYRASARSGFDIVEGFGEARYVDSAFPGSEASDEVFGEAAVRIIAGVSGGVTGTGSPVCFYGRNTLFWSISAALDPDIGGFADGVPGVDAAAAVGGNILAGPQLRIGASLQAAATNTYGANGLLVFRSGFETPPWACDLRVHAGLTAQLPIAYLDFNLGAVVVDRLGFSAGLEWGASADLPGIRNAAHTDRIVASAVWYEETGSFVGAPGSSAAAAAALGTSPADFPAPGTEAGFYPDDFLTATATIDLGIGSWASTRPLLQIGAAVLIPLDSGNLWDVKPFVLLDLMDLL